MLSGAGLAILLVGLAGAPTFAVTPTYDGMRKWIEEQKPNDKTTASEPVFISYVKDGQKWTTIISYRTGMTLRDVIDGTKAGGDRLGVTVLREGDGIVFEQSVGPTDRPDFQVQPLDAICLHDVLV